MWLKIKTQKKHNSLCVCVCLSVCNFCPSPDSRHYERFIRVIISVREGKRTRRSGGRAIRPMSERRWRAPSRRRQGEQAKHLHPLQRCWSGWRGQAAGVTEEPGSWNIGQGSPNHELTSATTFGCGRAAAEGDVSGEEQSDRAKAWAALLRFQTVALMLKTGYFFGLCSILKNLIKILIYLRNLFSF